MATRQPGRAARLPNCSSLRCTASVRRCNWPPSSRTFSRWGAFQQCHLLRGRRNGRVRWIDLARPRQQGTAPVHSSAVQRR